jgi:prepilin-type processing-associated H-X9-DG protein
MKQFGLSVQMYAADYDDRFVPATNYDAATSDPSRLWAPPMQRYVKNEELFVAPGTEGSFAATWAERHGQTVGMNAATSYARLGGENLDPSRICQPGELRFDCSAFSSAASLSQMEEPSRVALFATTPGGEPGSAYRGYSIGPSNGSAYWGEPAVLEEAADMIPLVSDRDLVPELAGELEPGAIKPVWARYGAEGNNNGRTPVVFGDGHASSHSAREVRSGGELIWRFR